MVMIAGVTAGEIALPSPILTDIRTARGIADQVDVVTTDGLRAVRHHEDHRDRAGARVAHDHLLRLLQPVPESGARG